MKRYIRSNSHNKYIVVLQDGELLKGDKGQIMQLNDEVETASVNSLAEASAAVRDYIDEKLLGSSTFTGGAVLDGKTHKQVARISYNGRIWDLDGNEISDADIDSVHASMDLEELEDAVMHGKPFEADAFNEYWEAYHQPEEGAITADEVSENDVIENTEDASEINIGDVFHVNSITPHAPGWEEFDYEFDVTLLNGDYEGDEVKLHYMADEYVGIRSDVGRALGIYNSTKITASSKVKVSSDLRSILEDVMIDTLDEYSGKHVLVEFIENVRYLQDWDEYADEHADEVIELQKLSDSQLTDIGAEILDEIKADWQDDQE